MFGAIPHGERAWDAERVKAVDIAARGQHVRCSQQIATWRWCDIATIERVQQRIHLGVNAELRIGSRQRFHHSECGFVLRDAGDTQRLLSGLAGHDGFDGCAIQLYGME